MTTLDERTIGFMYWGTSPSLNSMLEEWFELSDFRCDCWPSNRGCNPDFSSDRNTTCYKCGIPTKGRLGKICEKCLVELRAFHLVEELND